MQHLLIIFRKRVSSLERHTTGFGIAFPQDNLTNESIAEEEEHLNEQLTHHSTRFANDETPHTPDTGSHTNGSSSVLMVPDAPAQSRRKSRDISDILGPNNPRSRPISGESSEADIEIRDFSSRNDTFFGESDDDISEGMGTARASGYSNMGDSVHGMNAAGSINGGDQYPLYHDEYDDNTVRMSHREMEQLAKQHYAECGQDVYGYMPDDQTLTQPYTFYSSRLEAIPESPALTTKTESPVLKMTSNDDSSSSHANQSRLSQQFSTPTTTTESLTPHTPATSAPSSATTPATVTPTAGLKVNTNNNTPGSASSSSSGNLRPKKPSSTHVSFAGKPEVIPITPTPADNYEGDHESHNNPAVSKISPTPPSQVQAVSPPKSTPQVSTPNPQVVPRPRNGHHKSSSSSSSLISRLSFGLFSSKSPSGKAPVSSSTPHQQYPESPAPFPYIAPHQLRNNSFRSKTISGLGRRRKLGHAKLGPIGYSYESYGDSNNNNNNGNKGYAGNNNSAKNKNIIVFNKPSSEINAPPIHKHKGNSASVDNADAAAAISSSNIQKPARLMSEHPDKNDSLFLDKSDNALESSASSSTASDQVVTRKRSRSLLSKKRSLPKLTKEPKRPIISAPIQGYIPSTAEVEKQLPEKLQQPSYPPPLPPPLQEQQEQLQRLLKQQQELEEKQKSEQERKLREKKAQQQRELELQQHQFQLQREQEIINQPSYLPYPTAPFRHLEPVEEVPSETSSSPQVPVLHPRDSAGSSLLPSSRNSPRIPRSSPWISKSPRSKNGQFSRSGENLLGRSNSIISMVSSSSALSGLSTVSGVSSNVSSTTSRNRRVHRVGRSHKHGSYRRVILQSPAPSPNPNSYMLEASNPNVTNLNNQNIFYNNPGLYNRSARSLANDSTSSFLRTAFVPTSTVGASAEMAYANSEKQDLNHTYAESLGESHQQEYHDHQDVSESAPLLENGDLTITGHSLSSEPQYRQPVNRNYDYPVNSLSSPTSRPENEKTHSFASNSSDGTINDATGLAATAGTMEGALFSSNVPAESANAVLVNPADANNNNAYRQDHQSPQQSSQHASNLQQYSSIGGVMTAKVQSYLSDNNYNTNSNSNIAGSNSGNSNNSNQYPHNVAYKPAPSPMSLASSTSNYPMDTAEKSPDGSVYPPPTPSSYTAHNVHGSTVPITPVTPRGPYIPSSYNSGGGSSNNHATPMSARTIVNRGEAMRNTPQRSVSGNASNFFDDSGDWEDYPEESTESFYPAMGVNGAGGVNGYYNSTYQRMDPQQQQAMLQAMNERDMHRLREMIVQEKRKTKKMKRKMEKKRKMEEDLRKREEWMMSSVADTSSRGSSYFNTYAGAEKEEVAKGDNTHHTDGEDTKGGKVKNNANTNSMISNQTGATTTTVSTDTTNATSGSGTTTTTDNTAKSRNSNGTQGTHETATTASDSTFSLTPGVTAAADIINSTVILTNTPLHINKPVQSLDSSLEPQERIATTIVTNNRASLVNIPPFPLAPVPASSKRNSRQEFSSRPEVPSRQEASSRQDIPSHQDMPLRPVATEVPKHSLTSSNTVDSKPHSTFTGSINSESKPLPKENQRVSRLRPFVSAPASSPTATHFDSSLSRKEKKKQKKIAKEQEARERQENFTKHWQERQAIFEARQREMQEKKELERSEKKKKKNGNSKDEALEKGGDGKSRKRSKSFGFFMFGSNKNDTEDLKMANGTDAFGKEKGKVAQPAMAIKMTGTFNISQQPEILEFSNRVSNQKALPEVPQPAVMTLNDAKTDSNTATVETSQEMAKPVEKVEAEKVGAHKQQIGTDPCLSQDLQNPAAQYQHAVLPLGQLDQPGSKQHQQEQRQHLVEHQNNSQPALQLEPAAVIDGDDGLASARRRRQSREFPPPEMLPVENTPTADFKIHTPPITSSSPLTEFSKNLNNKHHTPSHLASPALDTNASVDTGFTSNIIPPSLSKNAMPLSPETQGTTALENGPGSIVQQQQQQQQPNQHQYQQQHLNQNPLSSQPNLHSSITHSYSQPNSVSLAHPSVQPLPLPHSRSASDFHSSADQFSPSPVQPLFANNKSLSSMSLSPPSSHINTTYSTSSNKSGRLYDRVLTNEAAKANSNSKKKPTNEAARVYDQFFSNIDHHLISSEDEQPDKMPDQGNEAVSETLRPSTTSSRKKDHNIHSNHHGRQKSVADVDLVGNLHQDNKKVPKVPKVSSFNHPIDNIDYETDERYQDLDESQDDDKFETGVQNIGKTVKASVSTRTTPVPITAEIQDRDGSSPQQPIEFIDDDEEKEEEERSKTLTRESARKGEKHHRQKQKQSKESKAESKVGKDADDEYEDESDNSLVEVGYGTRNSSDTAELEEMLENKRSRRSSQKRLSGHYSDKEVGLQDPEFKTARLSSIAPPPIMEQKRSDHQKNKSLTFAPDSKPAAEDVPSKSLRQQSASSKSRKSKARKSGISSGSGCHRRTKTIESGYSDSVEYPHTAEEYTAGGPYPYEYPEPMVPYYAMSPGPHMMYGHPDPNYPYNRVHGPMGPARHREMYGNMPVWGQSGPYIYPSSAPHPIHQRTASLSTATTTTTGAPTTSRISTSSTVLTSPVPESKPTSKYEEPQPYMYNPNVPPGMVPAGPGMARYPYMIAPGYAIHAGSPVAMEYPPMMMPLGVASGVYGYEGYEEPGYDITPGVYSQYRRAHNPNNVPSSANNNNSGNSNSHVNNATTSRMSPQVPGDFSSLMEFLDQVRGQGGSANSARSGRRHSMPGESATTSDEEAAIAAGGKGFAKGYDGAQHDMFFVQLQRQVEAAERRLLRQKRRQDRVDKELQKQQQQQSQPQYQKEHHHHHLHHRQSSSHEQKWYEKSRERQLLELAREEEKRLQRKEKRRKEKEQKELSGYTDANAQYEAAAFKEIKSHHGDNAIGYGHGEFEG